MQEKKLINVIKDNFFPVAGAIAMFISLGGFICPYN